MGDDIAKGTTYATGGSGGQGVITSANLNAHVDDATIKPTFISTKAARTPGDLADNILLESSGALYRMPFSTLQILLVTAAAVPTGSVIQTGYGEYTANANLTVPIPGADAIPQNTQGTEILSVSITPRFSTSTILATFRGQAHGPAATAWTVALFRDSGVNAVAAELKNFDGTTNSASLTHMDSPATTSAVTYKIRAGLTAAGTMRFNGTTSVRYMGGTSKATLVLQEIKG